MGKPEKVKVRCPECGVISCVLWFRGFGMVYRSKGTTGASGNTFVGRSEKVEGNCEKCNYRFKVDDL